jgi:glucose-6-phosphate-specific signal transduction histidine kinase
VYEALGHIANPNLPSTPEQLESEFMKKMAEIQQLAMKVQENPQLLQTLDPGQLQMLKQMQAYMQQMQQMQQQNVAINMQFMQGPSINTMKK